MLTILALPVIAGAAFAQEGQPTDDEVNAIAKQLYCPVCENVPLDVCPTLACKDWREDIRSKLALGWSDEEIIQYFVDQHGAQVLPAPPPVGLNLLAYLLPPAAVLVGAVILFRLIRQWRADPPAPMPSPGESDVDDPYVERLEDELRRRV
jgi:cytochrome c-type biogenesis protein CcmH